MNPTLRQKLLVELLGIGMTALVVIGVLYPIFQNFSKPFPFLQPNIIVIVLFLTYMRYIFLLKYTWFGRLFYIKMALLLLSFPLGMWLAYESREFLEYVDTQLPDALLRLMRPDRTEEQLVSLVAYVRNEYTFFGVAAFLANVALFFRLLMSVWRGANTGEI